MGASKVFERLYRMDEKAEEDWSLVASTIPAPGQGRSPDPPPPDAGGAESGPLRVEYLLDVLQRQQWYSVQVPVERQGEDGVMVRRKEPQHFQLLNITSSRSRPRLMPTIESWSDPALRRQLALNIQETSTLPLADGEGDGDGSVIIYPDAAPRWIGYEDLAPWHAVFSTLTRFTATRGIPNRAGCLLLSGPEIVRTIHPLTDLKCPCLCILTELYRRGWQPKRRTAVHDSPAITEMDGRDAVKMKAYYIVILELDRCLPLTSSIPSNQPILYYRLLLAGREVEPGLGKDEYRRLWRLMTEGAEPDVPAVEDEDEGGFDFVLPGRVVPKAHALPSGSAEDEEDPRRAHREADILAAKAPPAAKAKAKGRGKGKGKSKRKIAGPKAPAPLPPPPVPPAPAVLLPPAPAAALAEEVSGFDFAVASSSSSGPSLRAPRTDRD